MIAPIPLLLIIVLVLMFLRGGLRPVWPVWKRGDPPVTDPLRLLLFVILVLLVIGLMLRLLMPLGSS